MKFGNSVLYIWLQEPVFQNHVSESLNSGEKLGLKLTVVVALRYVL